MAENAPLSSRSATKSEPITYKIVDQTEFAANKNILGQVFESDIVITKEQMLDVISSFQERLNGTGKRAKRKTIVGDRFRWPNQTVPFVFRDTNPKWQLTVWNGMRIWEAETCIKFKQLHPKTNEKNYIYLIRGGGCYSSVGRVGGKQTASIGYGCESAGVVAHEMGHALGFWHEQSRADRDKYINLNEEHLLKGTKGNFEKRHDTETMEIPYDFGSVMHYGSQAFTNDYKYVTVETKDHRYQHTIGQRVGLSFTDIKFANLMYCADKCANLHNCYNGGYQDPTNCLSCKCPPGLSGDCNLVEPSTAACGGELIAASNWQTLTNIVAGRCVWRLTAPANQRIHFEVVDTKYSCDSSCSENYLEIKHNGNWQQTGFRQCCRAMPGAIISSKNQVIIISQSKNSPANFTIRYIIDSPMLPNPPPAPWEGDGLTTLLSGETGIDKTFENYIFNDLPKVFKKSKPLSNKPFDALTSLVTSFLKSTRTS